jgi:hypothetical protein
MNRMILLFSLLVALSGCQREYGEFIRYYDDGRMKPRVAFLPIIDRSQQELPWRISEELASGIREKLKSAGNVYLTGPELIRRGYETISAEEWVAADLEEFRLFAPDHDFVVLVELLDHAQEAYNGQKVQPVYPISGKAGSVLKITVHLKVIDIRKEVPRTILTQYLHSNHLVPVARVDLDYRQIPWKATTYKETPVGRAHARLERDIVAQLEKYITYHAN